MELITVTSVTYSSVYALLYSTRFFTHPLEEHWIHTLHVFFRRHLVVTVVKNRNVRRCQIMDMYLENTSCLLKMYYRDLDVLLFALILLAKETISFDINRFQRSSRQSTWQGGGLKRGCHNTIDLVVFSSLMVRFRALSFCCFKRDPLPYSRVRVLHAPRSIFNSTETSLFR